MKPSLQGGGELRATLAAVPSAAEDFILEFRRWAQLSLARPHRFVAELLAREALNNAVVHGCQSDPHKHLRCVLRLNVRRLAIAVEDDGDGFDWRAAMGRSPGVSAASGRGLGILLRYATRVRFNHKGNAVWIVKRFCEAGK